MTYSIGWSGSGTTLSVRISATGLFEYAHSRMINRAFYNKKINTFAYSMLTKRDSNPNLLDHREGRLSIGSQALETHVP